jgi:putrescine aminotransferase
MYTNITGKGLIIGQHFVNDDIGYAVASGLFKRGVLISGTLNNSRVIRVEPPLIITREEIDTILNRLEDTLQELRTSVSTPGVPDTGGQIIGPASEDVKKRTNLDETDTAVA